MERLFIEKLEYLLKNHLLEETKEFFESSLEDALIKKNTPLIILILNEMIGFYRDISEHDISYKYANSLKGLIERLDVDDHTKFISKINVANAYRAFGDVEGAIHLFIEAKNLYEDRLSNDVVSYSALLNNLALTYQQQEKYSESIELFKKCLDLLPKEESIKIGSTYSNIAMSYIGINNLEMAELYSNKSLSIFENNKDDFHYSSSIGAKAKILFLKGEYQKAFPLYEETLANLKMTVGFNAFYYEVFEEYKKVCEKINVPIHIEGIKLSKDYFESIKTDFFSKIPVSLRQELTIGLFGLGSECFFADDLISEDHDFDPGFIVLVNDEVSENDFQLIQSSYDSLPKIYRRFFIQNLNKKGVHRYSKYLAQFLGYSFPLSTQSKGLITNGILFYEGAKSKFSSLRYKIKKEERYEYIPSLIYKTLSINQYIPYNLKRAIDRNEEETYLILKNHLVDNLIEYYYIYHQKFIPHDKLAYRLIDDKSIIKTWINKILHNKIEGLFEEISYHLLKVLKNLNCIEKINTVYIEDYRNELEDYLSNYYKKLKNIKEIVSLEWEMFSSSLNFGGKASCQTNPKYFTLMRESQFLAWDYESICSYLNDLTIAKNNSYNLVSIKYAFMEESTHKEEFDKIKDRLPFLSEKRKLLQEQIIQVQMEQVDEYLKKNPDDEKVMRSIYSSSDSSSNTSYETYLRGELSSYSEKTVFLYAKNLTKLSKSKKNIVENIILYSKLFFVEEEY